MPMTSQEREIIDDLFDKLRHVEMQAGTTRDREAEAHIRDRIAGQPGAPYFMAQTIVMQDQALHVAQARIDHLEDELARRPRGGGLMSGFFGGGNSLQTARLPQPEPDNMQGMVMPPSPGDGSRIGMPPRGAPGSPPPRGGGGFLAGAASTAMGVAGGMMLGSMLSSVFEGAGEAQAASSPAPSAEPAAAVEDDASGYFGDDFGDEI